MKERKRIAIIGGGPGGLMTAYRLGKQASFPMEITLFEASGRLGGKVKTMEFSSASVRYEAGAAELYDYSQLGPDPLRELVHELGLTTSGMSGGAVIMNGHILKTHGDIREAFGEATCRALRKFEWRGRSAITPADYYESDWQADNEDSLSNTSFAALLDELRDENARRYIEVAVHSDLATEPEKTTGMYGLQNYLMDLPQYMRLYTIDGGIERLTQSLAERICQNVNVKLHQPVISVRRTDDGYVVSSRLAGETLHDEFDFVVVALPNNWIPLIDWRGETLSKAMREHSAHYAYPAHYLRVSMLFERPFWRNEIADSFFMSDAFGGCCVYDESSRNGNESYGVLGWLLGGEAALTMANVDDSTLVARVLDSLPPALRHGKDAFVEARVHRWLGAVSGRPGGKTLRDPDYERHVPDPEDHPDLFVVGDYLYDATLNGVLDSVDTVIELVAERADELAAEETAATLNGILDSAGTVDSLVSELATDEPAATTPWAVGATVDDTARIVVG